MFEDSTFESAGKIHTRSTGWMIATFAFNSAILVALILIPLIYPEALPRFANIILMEAPAPPEPRPVVETRRAPTAPSEIQDGSIVAPSRIPRIPYIPGTPEEPTNDTVAALAGGENGPGSPDNPIGRPAAHFNVREAVRSTQHVSSGVMVGYLLNKVLPQYPSIAVAVHMSGRVVLQATISKSGTIENLRVVSGPAMLQQAAIDAVQQWRYRPYLLNGEPVEVETTVNVDFTMQ